MKRVVSIILLVSVLVIFASCGSKKTEPFQCEGCGKTITDGSRHEVKDSYGDKWSYCDNCYSQIVEMRKSLG